MGRGSPAPEALAFGSCGQKERTPEASSARASDPRNHGPPPPRSVARFLPARAFWSLTGSCARCFRPELSDNRSPAAQKHVARTELCETRKPTLCEERFASDTRR